MVELLDDFEFFWEYFVLEDVNNVMVFVVVVEIECEVR